MTDLSALSAALAEAAVSTLENMCFASVLEPTAELGSDTLSAEVRFDGDAAGAVRLELTRDAALGLSSNFLGLEEDEMTQGNVDAVLLELSNMICGRMLSVHAPDGSFRLDSPYLVETATVPMDATCSFELDVGRIGCAARYAPAREAL